MNAVNPTPSGDPRYVTNYPQVILLHGLKGSGKSTAAGYLQSTIPGAKRERFARELKDMLAQVLYQTIMKEVGGLVDSVSKTSEHSFLPKQAWGMIEPDVPEQVWGKIARILEGDMKETPNPFFSGLSARTVMQFLADGVHKYVSESYWVRSTLYRVINAVQRGESVIIEDLRYPNYAEPFKRCLTQLGIPVTTVKINRTNRTAEDGASEEPCFGAPAFARTGDSLPAAITEEGKMDHADSLMLARYLIDSARAMMHTTMGRSLFNWESGFEEPQPLVWALEEALKGNPYPPVVPKITKDGNPPILSPNDIAIAHTLGIADACGITNQKGNWEGDVVSPMGYLIDLFENRIFVGAHEHQKKAKEAGKDTHSSESGLPDDLFDIVVSNDGTRGELFMKLRDSLRLRNKD